MKVHSPAVDESPNQGAIGAIGKSKSKGQLTHGVVTREGRVTHSLQPPKTKEQEKVSLSQGMVRTTREGRVTYILSTSGRAGKAGRPNKRERKGQSLTGRGE